MDYRGEGHHHHHHHHGEGGGYREGFQEGYQAGEFQQPGFQPGGYPQPGYPQPGYAQPGFQQGGYPQPGYQAGYQQPSMGGQQYGGPRREFYIVSEMNGKVVDIEGAHSGEGIKLITYHKHNDLKRNQLWYMDNQGFIRSALNDMTFRNAERGHHLKTAGGGMGDPRAQWRLNGNKIINMAGEVLDIAGRHSHDGAEIISYQDDGGTNQHWRIEYVN